jgi:hypothetical protein
MNRGLLFIPDISGFTRFINETEIEHSRLIIQELLEILVNANDIGLEVSEIEGDAILFYRYGDPPDLIDLYRQVEKMFCEFHKSLIAYDQRKFCHCKACGSAVGLTLKVITHYGEFTGYKVKNFSKLIGKDIIVAHQLLKNEIEQHEYWLVTENLLQDGTPDEFAQWMMWNASAKQTESGEVPFHYTLLSQLKNEIHPEQFAQTDLSNMKMVLTTSKTYDAGIIALFHAAGDFNFRAQWQEGVKRVEEVNHFLPRVGMRCRLVMDNGEEVIYSTSYTFGEERIEFTESDEDGKNCRRFILEKQQRGTRLTLQHYIRKNPLNVFGFMLFRKKKMNEAMLRSMEQMAEVVKQIKIPEQAETEAASL